MQQVLIKTLSTFVYLEEEKNIPYKSIRCPYVTISNSLLPLPSKLVYRSKYLDLWVKAWHIYNFAYILIFIVIIYCRIRIIWPDPKYWLLGANTQQYIYFWGAPMNEVDWQIVVNSFRQSASCMLVRHTQIIDIPGISWKRYPQLPVPSGIAR